MRPAVATLSLGLLGGAWSHALDAAASALVRDHNVTLVAAAGNGCCPQAGHRLYPIMGPVQALMQKTLALMQKNCATTCMFKFTCLNETLSGVGSVTPAQYRVL